MLAVALKSSPPHAPPVPCARIVFWTLPAAPVGGVTTYRPPPVAAELLAIVEAMTARVPLEKMPPPREVAPRSSTAVLPLTVELPRKSPPVDEVADVRDQHDAVAGGDAEEGDEADDGCHREHASLDEHTGCAADERQRKVHHHEHRVSVIAEGVAHYQELGQVDPTIDPVILAELLANFTIFTTTVGPRWFGTAEADIRGQIELGAQIFADGVRSSATTGANSSRSGRRRRPRSPMAK